MGGASLWEQHEIEAKLEAILETIQPVEERSHLGRPFVSAYQLALAFRDTYQQTFDDLGKPVGGEGVGQHHSLTQYLARELSNRIRKGETIRIEGAPLTHLYIRTLDFKGGNEEVRSSLQKEYLTLFRLRD